MSQGALSFQSYTVAGTIVNVISGRNQSSLSVLNTSSMNTVYLSDQSGFTVATGVPLGPGSTILWDEGRDLYLLATVAAPATVAIYGNSGGIFDAGAIAAQIINQGLAGDIADLIQIQGAPPINTFDAFATLQFTSTGANFNSIVYDVTKYQSINFFLGDAAGAFGAPLPRRVDFQWMNDAAGTIPLAVDTVYLTDTNANGSGTVAVNTQGSVPTRSGFLKVIMYATARTGTTCQIFLNGSYRTAAQLIYRNISGYFGTSPAAVAGTAGERFASMNFGAVPAATVYTEYPPAIAGAVMFSYRVVLAAGGIGLTLFVNDLVSNSQIFSFLCPAGAISQNVQPLIIPNHPISVVASCGAAVVTTQCVTSLAYQT